ncbi:hypothetical protein Sango_1922600 [Sesamum angolense]|uniref:RNase H type-1 domain-containing protein n=1 Tax=Sesamum angolense TaxID=2727404 RepID=A0AAE1WDP1_9LAMI|nr:hypothetical protein Sango_1922600 [Sesamum angolense]
MLMAPPPSRVGIVLTSLEADELEYALKFELKASNNKAKCEALIVRIRMTLDVGARSLITYSDSQLVTNQLVGDTYDIKEDQMKEYLEDISELTSQLKSFSSTRFLTWRTIRQIT